MDVLLNPIPQNEALLENVCCPLCSSAMVVPFVYRKGVPVLTNLLLATPEEARQVPQGTLHLVVCRVCGFVFNSEFEASTLYNEHYNNSQAYAPAFEAYLETLISSLTQEHHLQQCRILEIGCGDGRFLRKLVEAGVGITGYGFDPSYRGPTSLLDGRLQFEARYYDETCGDFCADVLICRHVIEHIKDPVAFLRMLRRTLSRSPQIRLFLETPDVAWILRNGVIWDLYYEHCSYFCTQTITLVLMLAGFHVQRIEHTFHEQYLWVEATVATNDQLSPLQLGTSDIPALAAQFHQDERCSCEQWKRLVQALRKEGPVAFLGAAGKGVTLTNLLDPDAELIACIVDLNPHKQHRFLPGTGHPIVAYEEMKAYGITSAVLLNPNYYEDTLNLLSCHHLQYVELVTEPGSQD